MHARVGRVFGPEGACPASSLLTQRGPIVGGGVFATTFMSLIGNRDRASPAHEDAFTAREVRKSFPHDGQHVFVH